MTRVRMRPAIAALIVAACIAPCTAAADADADPAPTAPDLRGIWYAYEAADQTTSTIELSLDAGRLSGRMLAIAGADGQPRNWRCERCDGDLHQAPVVGARFLRDLKPDQGRWIDGDVVDLRPGLTQGVHAKAELALDEQGRLTLLGYRGLRSLGQSRVWTRDKTERR
ncbi:Uncharacterized conserved protein, DUF2147 family [Hydrocarboniphaga daqingensis]|uniref:Uncharacterized conserved protein, DUF2147 family n=1 Tax=Hydrocarboniphaga daqingensis TaxID=490188 RepID=A0A1M5LYL2_9GAMM|nr:DUF2147 domain-containing protein [Hydrocarboniphaga daqingensis]SHG69739.1 Uncharacterized conserved protein, DUF2147 family [Hydrocarboniphaga daqingensis]